MSEAPADPVPWFNEWLGDAVQKEDDANAAALATVGADGVPSVRMVLVKQHDAQGFVFYTNLGSRKALELQGNPNAALCFHWKSLRRQVRVAGPVAPVTDEEADAYFASRPRTSQIGAWASHQSRPMEGRWSLEQAVAKMTAKFGVGRVPRPPFWSGFRLVPSRIEFWQDMTYRLHRRWEYTRAGGGWEMQQLYP